MKGIRLKYLAELNPKTNLQTLQSEDMVSFAPMECVKQGNMMPYEKSINDYNSSYNLFRHGDIVLAKVTPCFENGNIAIATALKNDMGYGSSELFVIRANKCNNVYLFYLLQSNQFRQTAISTMTGAGGLKRVSPDAIRNLIVPIADVNIQQRIADYLERKTEAIDSLIADKQKLVELLKEKRNTVISEAVTKGLDKTARMKDSGIDWIGEIPEGWKKSKIGFYFDSQLGKMLQPNPNSAEDTLEFYLCAANVKRTGISMEPQKEMWFSASDKKTYKVVSGDLLVVEGGDIGLSCIYSRQEPTYIQNALHRIRSNHNAINTFLVYWMDYLKNRGYMDLVCNKATIAHYTKEKLINSPFIAPPVPAQQAIVDYLDRKTAEIDSLISDINEQIEKLNEYRQSVISEMVTGKVAV